MRILWSENYTLTLTYKANFLAISIKSLSKVLDKITAYYAQVSLDKVDPRQKVTYTFQLFGGQFWIF